MPATWPDVVKTWVLRVPGILLLAALIFCVVLMTIFLMTTPECERRAFAFGIEVDRTKLKDCGTGEIPPQPDPSSSASPASAQDKPTTPDKPPIAKPVSMLPDISFDPKGREIFRGTHGLTLVDVETAVLDETPKSTFGFAYGGSFASVWKDKLGILTVRSTPRSVHFEVQKRSNGAVYIVGFMRGDSAREMQQTNRYPSSIKLYSERYKPTDAIVAIPVSEIGDVGQSVIDISGSKYIPVLDISFGSRVQCQCP